MKLKALIFSAVLILASVTFGYVKSTGSARQESVNQTARLTLKQRTQKAREKGEAKVSLHGPITNKAQFTNLADALNVYHLMKVELIDKKGVIENENIYSWYKFKIIDDISQSKTAYDFSFMTPPPEMLPLQQDEVLVSTDGGVVTIDGIEVSSGEPGEPVFDRNKQYLLFLCVDPATKIATINMGAAGVFSLGEDDTFAPFNKNKHHVYDALGANSISVVKRKLQRRGKQVTEVDRPFTLRILTLSNVRRESVKALLRAACWPNSIDRRAGRRRRKNQQGGHDLLVAAPLAGHEPRRRFRGGRAAHAQTTGPEVR